jgi:hypothetical protein
MERVATGEFTMPGDPRMPGSFKVKPAVLQHGADIRGPAGQPCPLPRTGEPLSTAVQVGLGGELAQVVPYSAFDNVVASCFQFGCGNRGAF